MPSPQATTVPPMSIENESNTAIGHAPAQALPEPINAPVLEREVLDELFEIAGDEINAIIEVFLAETPRMVQQLQDAASISDVPRMGELAHSLKSSSANLGALALSEAARRLEHEARSDTLQRPAVMVALIVAEFARVRVALLGYQASLRGVTAPQG
jgi:HPt (histidine-containing phosphotransfer) domain-containing protein